jgi:hypothetical protein
MELLYLYKFEVSCQHHTQAAIPPEEEPLGTHRIGGFVGLEQVWVFFKRKIITCPCREKNAGQFTPIG